MMDKNTDKKIINYIKSIGIDMINNAGSGHPGIVLGAAPMIYTLFKNHLRMNTDDVNWINRDRFVMSAGHGSALLYSTMHMFGYPITINDLKNFRQVDSITPGHPEYGITPGVEATTGPLGQGFVNAVGMAIAEKHLKAKYGKDLFDYKVYVLCSDGDLMEGIVTEAASLAGTLKLNNLIVLYDSNEVSLDGPTSKAFTEDTIKKFEALGWNTLTVLNGDETGSIDKAINEAKLSSKPTLIEIKTIIGRDTSLAGTHEVHGKLLSKEDSENLRKLLLDEDKGPFYIPEDLLKTARSFMKDRVIDEYNNHLELSKNNSEVLESLKNKEIIIDISKLESELDLTKKEATRITNGKIMNKLVDLIPNFIGGSADLGSSTKTHLNNEEDMSVDNYSGKNIWFGVREHAMGSIVNGLALSGLRAFCSTFLVFSDYMRPSIRLSALMNIPSIFIFSHDAVNIGQDGPTHQPIEHLTMLRSTPNLTVFRPADGKELLGSWNEMLKLTSPSCLILGRGDVPQLEMSSSEGVSKGAYILKQEEGALEAVVIATGSEVTTAINVVNQLHNKENIRVVSMPSQEIFLKQTKEYQESILPSDIKRIVIEAGSSFSWHRFVSDEESLITIDNFGASGPSKDVLEYCNFTEEQIKKRIEKNFK